MRYTLTRAQPAEWHGWSGRVNETMLSAMDANPSDPVRAFVCGPTGFVDVSLTCSSGSATIHDVSRPSDSARQEADPMTPAEHHTDGNAIAGTIEQILAVEFTTVLRRCCQSCGDENPAGAHRAYQGAGLVLRCPSCNDVALRISTQPSCAVFELRGVWTSRTDA